MRGKGICGRWTVRAINQPATQPASETGEKGSAFAVVMMPLLVATVIAASLTAATRTDLTIGHNVEDGVRMRLAADALINRTLARLASKRPQDWPMPDGRVDTLSFDDIEVKMSVTSEAAKINLNEVPNPALRRLLELSCVGESEATTIADRLADYLDEDDAHRLQGEEKPAYAARGLPYGPRNDRLQTVDELRRIPGITAELLQRIRPFVTAHGYHRAPDLRLATPQVIRAVLDASKTLAETGPKLPPPVPNQPAASGPFVGVITLTAWGVRDGKDQPATIKTVYLTGNPQRPLIVLDYAQDVAMEPEVPCDGGR